jgi:zinc protease
MSNPYTTQAAWLCAALATGLAGLAHARAPDTAPLPGAEDVVARTLPNGLQIIVWPDHDIPNVALYNWVRVGSRNERPGITGLSHFFEHMMFNGTSTRPPGDFDRLMEAAGGSNNAYTSEDVTVYQDWFPRSALGLIFDLEGDRLRNLAFDPEVVESERGVVYSERRSSVDDDIAGKLAEQVQATAFVAHTYQIPVIGWPSDIESWRMEDLKEYFRTYYAPNNCTFVVVGDVEPDEVFALAERHLGPIPAQDPPPALRTVEPEQTGERRVMLVEPAQTPILMVAFKAPAAADPAVPALELLMDVLVGGDYARLHRVLVEEAQVAIAINGYLQRGFDPGLAWLQVTLPAGGDVAKVERLLHEQLALVVRGGVTTGELERARNVVTAQFLRGLATINGKASALGRYQVMHGDYRRLFDAPATYAAVTPDDVRAVAARVFDPRRRTVGVVDPAAAEAAAEGEVDDAD